MEHEWNTCPLHGNVYTHYCRGCGEPVCVECIGHKSHDVESISEFVEEGKEMLPNINMIGKLDSQIKDGILKTEQLGTNLVSKCDCLRKCISILEIITSKPQETLENDLNLVEKVKYYLMELSSQARTTTLVTACNKARELFNIEEEIETEVKDSQLSLKEKNQEYQDGLIEIGKLTSQLKMLQKAGETIRETHDRFKEDDILVLLLLKEKGLLDFEVIKPQVDRYEAFPDIQTSLDMTSQLTQTLSELPNGIKVSTPTKFGMKLRTTGNYFSTTISHNGILAIHSRTSSSVVELTDLITERQVSVPVLDFTTVAFYDDKLIFLTSLECMRRGIVENIFRTPSVSTLRQIGSIKVDNESGVSRLHYTRTLYYKSIDNGLYEFNVDTNTNTKIDTSGNVGWIASFTGIDPGVRAIFKDESANRTLVLHTDYSISTLSASQRGWLTAFIPSYLSPDNLKEGAFKYDSTLIYRDRGVNLGDNVKLERVFSIVRLYQDVFLMLNEAKREWVLMRIIVP